MGFHKPVIRVWVSGNISGWIVSDDVIKQVCHAGVLQLMRLSGRANETVTSSNRYARIASAKFSRSADNNINFPLGGMSVEWKVGRARGESRKLDIERVTAARNASVAGCTERLGDVTTEEMKTSTW